MPLQEAGSVQGLYERMAQEREPFLRRGRDAARLTLPYLLPDDDVRNRDGSKNLPTPWQSVGSGGVTNLANKLLLSLFPTGRSFVELSPDLDSLERSGLDDLEIQEAILALQGVERSINRVIETEGMRVDLYEALLHLVAAGNVLLYLPPREKLQLFRMDSYAQRLDNSGRVSELVTLEFVDPVFLPEEALAAWEKLHPDWRREDGHKKKAEVYTYVFRNEESSYTVWQEVGKAILDRRGGVWQEEELPYLPLRLNRSAGENYGRGRVEEFLGDLKSLESLSRSIVEFAAAASKVVWMRDPAGVSKPRDVASAPSGAIVTGNASEYSPLRLDKFADFSVAQTAKRDLESRLDLAFLRNQTVQRPGERVTAEEIRFLARELEEGLGGVYSALTEELQLPLARALIRRAGARLPEEVARPRIVTGLAALGREDELGRVDAFVARGQAMLGPEEFARRVRPDGLLNELAIGTGVDRARLIRPEEEVQAERQAEAQALQAQAALQAGIPPAAKEVGKRLAEQVIPQ